MPKKIKIEYKGKKVIVEVDVNEERKWVTFNVLGYAKFFGYEQIPKNEADDLLQHITDKESGSMEYYPKTLEFTYKGRSIIKP